MWKIRISWLAVCFYVSGKRTTKHFVAKLPNSLCDASSIVYNKHFETQIKYLHLILPGTLFVSYLISFLLPFFTDILLCIFAVLKFVLPFILHNVTAHRILYMNLLFTWTFDPICQSFYKPPCFSPIIVIYNMSCTCMIDLFALYKSRNNYPN